MADSVGTIYRLRAGNPMPTGNGSVFKLHTFMAEESAVEVYTCTEDLPATRDFRAQGGDYTSAQFSRLPIVGGAKWQGKATRFVDYIDEGAFGFN